MATTNAVERLEARVTVDQKRLIKDAAEARGVTVTDFIVSTMHEAAVRVLSDLQLLSMSRRDQEAFADALLRSDTRPNDKLRAAAERHGYAPTPVLR